LSPLAAGLVVAGVWLGERASRDIPGDLFQRIVHVSLVIMGGFLVLRTVAA